MRKVFRDSRAQVAHYNLEYCCGDDERKSSVRVLRRIRRSAQVAYHLTLVERCLTYPPLLSRYDAAPAASSWMGTVFQLAEESPVSHAAQPCVDASWQSLFSPFRIARIKIPDTARLRNNVPMD